MKKIIIIGLLVLIPVILESYTYQNVMSFDAEYQKREQEIFQSTCVHYNDGCNDTGTPYARELWPDQANYSTFAACQTNLRSFPFGFARVERSGGLPYCVRLEGMTHKETREFLEANELPKR